MPGSKVSVHHDDVESLKSGGCASGHQGFFSAELRHLFSSLCSDRASVVRKAAATIFPIFAESVELRHLSM